MNNKVINCKSCGLTLGDDALNNPRKSCPKCGSIERNVELIITETIEVHEKIGLKMYKDGFKKPRKELINGDEKFETQDRWVHKKRVIDREKDEYLETVKDTKTGEIIHHCEEPLSKHYNHGSAKGKKVKE